MSKIEIFMSRIRPKWSLIFEVTNDCNLRCPFCYVIRENRLKKEIILPDQFEHILNIYRPLYLQMTGGEATTHPDFIKLIEISNKYCVSTQISTNGLILDKYINEFTNLKKKPVIGISLDAPNELHDDIRNRKGLFKKIMKNIFLLREKKIPVAFAMTIFGKHDIENLPSGNLHFIDDMIAFCDKYQITVNIQPFNPAQKETRIQLGKILLKSKSKYVVNSKAYRKMLIYGNWGNCRFNWTQISINSKGKRLPTFPNKCYFCKDCSKCYYSCVWEPSLLTSKYLLPSAMELLKQAILLGVFN
ncbi:MAG: radical SAM protein [Candidatus Helarchaeota archaeon]